MGTLILRRLMAMIPVLVLVTFGVFSLIHLTPGDPIDAMMSESYDPQTKERLRHDLGLDQPIHMQYLTWIGRVLQGDFGRSIRDNQPVIENVTGRIRVSLQLALFAMAISLAVAFPIGILSAVHRNSSVDGFGTTFALFGICMPNFLIALLLIYLFGVTLHWLPISAVVTRTLRSSLLETLSEDYVRTARAKGLSEQLVIRRHALKNGLIPVVTILGLQLGALVGGAVITEYVFALPGVGRLVVDSIFSRDYPLVQGVILLIAIGFVLSNLVVDIVYGWLDPRIRYG